MRGEAVVADVRVHFEEILAASVVDVAEEGSG